VQGEILVERKRTAQDREKQPSCIGLGLTARRGPNRKNNIPLNRKRDAEKREGAFRSTSKSKKGTKP
jgi:hypothetical protein